MRAAFSNRSELETNFRKDAVIGNSVLLKPASVGEISDSDKHNVTFNPTGSRAFLHSQIRDLESETEINKAISEFRKQRIDGEYVERLSEELISIALDTRFAQTIPRMIYRLRPIVKAQYILGHIYDVSWVLIRES